LSGGSPYTHGDFVWCAFPERERPTQPGSPHISFVLAVSGVGSAPNTYAVMAAYTTSQPWPVQQGVPKGVFSIDAQRAAAMGQQRAFTIDARRIAFVSLTSDWFPDLGRPGAGKVGSAPKSLFQQVMNATNELLRRHPDVVERLGPLWPR
jgi:hypothetical protein